MKANKRKLRLAMARALMNTNDLVKATGMPAPTVMNVLKGLSIRPATAGRIAKALDVDVAEIMEDI